MRNTLETSAKPSATSSAFHGEPANVMVMPTCETAARQTAIELRPLKAESAVDSAISMVKLELVFDSTIRRGAW